MSSWNHTLEDSIRVLMLFYVNAFFMFHDYENAFIFSEDFNNWYTDVSYAPRPGLELRYHNGCTFGWRFCCLMVCLAILLPQSWFVTPCFLALMKLITGTHFFFLSVSIQDFFSKKTNSQSQKQFPTLKCELCISTRFIGCCFQSEVF